MHFAPLLLAALSFLPLATALAPPNCHNATRITSKELQTGNWPYVDIFTDPSALYLGAHPQFLPSPLIITQYANGSFGPEPNNWTFVACSNLDNHPFPPGDYFLPKSDDGVQYFFGIIQPSESDGSVGDSCLAIVPEGLSGPGRDGEGDEFGYGGMNVRHKVVLARECALVPEWQRTFMVVHYIYSYGAYYVYFADAFGKWVISGDTRNGDLLWYSNYTGVDGIYNETTLTFLG